MTVEELGALTRELTDAVVARDWFAAMSKLGAGWQAAQEFLAGFRDVPLPMGAAPGTPALAAGLATVDLGPLQLGAGELVAACDEAEARPGVMAGSVGAVGFNPMWIPIIIDGIRALAALIAEWRKNRDDDVEEG